MKMLWRRPTATPTTGAAANATTVLYCWIALTVPLHFASSYAPKVIRYRARIAYNGAGFQGFQLQEPSARTIQGELEGILTERFQQHVRVVGSGRTDAGVHARGQAIHFDLTGVPDDNGDEPSCSSLDLTAVEYSLNSMLRTDVRLWNLQQAPPPAVKQIGNTAEPVEMEWNAIFDSIGKLYSYRISTAAVMSPLERHARWHPDQVDELDIGKLEKVLKCYQGTHDFRAFAGAIEQLEKRLEKTVDTSRTVYSVDLVDEGSGNYRMDFHLKGALYKQVRNMVGTAIATSMGKLTEPDFHRLLSRHDGAVRDDNPCKPAPPEGLTLERVYFEDDF